VDKLLAFLRVRLDEAGLARLAGHESERMCAAYIQPGRGEVRAKMFTGCATCSREPDDYRRFYVEQWPCLQVRLLALPFTDDPDYREGWRPVRAVLAWEYPSRQDGDL
jgi:hypothetical protein